MAKTIRITAVPRDEVDLDKLAAALLHLARELEARRKDTAASGEVRHD